MGLIIIGLALLIIVAMVVGVVLSSATGQGNRSDHGSSPAFWSNPPDGSPHTHGTTNSSASDAASHRLHQQSDYHSAHESHHSWGGDSSTSDSGSSSGGGDGGSS